MPQILIVSNRLPVTVKKVAGKLTFETSMGGVATGLASYVANRKSKWIGWPGIASEDLTEADKKKIIKELAKRNCVPVFLGRKQLDNFYNGYSNSLLWPLFHNLPMAPAKDIWWQAYKSANRAFHDVVLQTATTTNSVWVQDYQLLLLPEMLKLERPKLHVGFFLHIPFPEGRSLRKLPSSELLLKGMLGADLVGFHTEQYVANFVKAVQQFDLGLSVDDQLILPDRTVQVTDFPMGIDYEKFKIARKSPAVKAAVKELKRKHKGMRIIAGVDRLDITKGFIERLNAYRDFLRQHQREIGKVVFVLVGAPSRGEIEAYQHLSSKVDTLVAAINSEFGTPRWQPVEYNNQGLSFEELTALFQIADVAFVAPLRDGMNLVAKEYIASKKKHGVLILSDTAGAAYELKDALLVSHKKPATLVAALDQALHMRKREMKSRFGRMQRHLERHTVHTWASDFMTTLQKPVPGTPNLVTRGLNVKLQTTIHARFLQTENRLLIVDCDSSLKDKSTSRKLLVCIRKLAADPATAVVIVSRYSAADLDMPFSTMPVSLVAESGSKIKLAGHSRWQHLSPATNLWKKEILPLLDTYSALTPKSQIDENPHSVVWKYPQSPPYYAQKNAVILKRLLKPYLKSYGLTLSQANKSLEIKDPNFSKAKALNKLLASAPSFVVAIGDDLSDEALFMALPTGSYSIKLGNGRTAARYRLPNENAAIEFLHMLSHKSLN